MCKSSYISLPAKICIFRNLAKHDLTLIKHKIMTFGDFVSLEGANDTFMVHTLHFWKKNLSLSVSHQNTRFPPQNSYFWAKLCKNRGKQTNWNFFLENRQTYVWSSTYFCSDNIGPIEKKLGHFKVKSLEGGIWSLWSRSFGRHLSLWNHISISKLSVVENFHYLVNFW